MSALKIGVGRAVITPPIGTLLMGYSARAAQSVHDDLSITAIAIEYGNTQAILLSADVCLLPCPLNAHIRNRIGISTGVVPENIILTTIHTHSGPSMIDNPGGAPNDEEYANTIFEPQAVAAASAAVRNLKPARMGIGATLSDVGVNRREIDRSGKVILGQNPWGCHDPVMTVVSFRGLDGKPIVSLIHYSAHCTAAGRNPEITRDWPGPMVDRLEAESGAPAVFFNGAIGDCGPRLSNGHTGGTLELAMELGGRAAIDAVRAYRTIKEYRDEDAGIVSGEIMLPYEPFPAAEAIEKRIAEMGDPGNLAGTAIMEYRTLQARLEESRTDKPRQTHMTLRQTVLSIGPVAFVPFPFEIFGEIALRLRKYSPFEHTLSLSNGNGTYAYFPSQDQIRRGGYEVWVFKSFNVYSLDDCADDAAVSENLRMLETLYSMRESVAR